MFRGRAEGEENVLTGNDYAQNLTDKTRQKGSAHKSVGKCDLPSRVTQPELESETESESELELDFVEHLTCNRTN